MTSLKDIWDRWTSTSLILRILGGILIGTVLALIVPGMLGIVVLGDIFVGALKAVAPILVLLIIISSIANSGSGLGSRFGFIITLYLGTTVIAAIIAVVMAYAFPVTVTFTGDPGTYEATTDVAEYLAQLLRNMVSNPVTAIMEGNYISILFWAALVGYSMKVLVSDTTKKMVSDLAMVANKIVSLFIQFAPIGILGIIYNTVSSNGLDIFVEYGQLILLLVATMCIVIFISNPIIAGTIMKGNPYPLLFRCLKDSGITAFFTRSSAACIPVNLKLCEDLGIDKEFYSVSIPLGATINMDGAAITVSIMSLVAAFSLGMDVPISMAMVLCIIATIAACGSSGITGGSLLLIPMCCSLLGISGDIAAQMIGIGFIIGVIQDSVETMLNVSSDALFTAVAEVSDRKKKGIDKPLNL